MREVYVNNLRKGIELVIKENNKIVEYYNLDGKKQNSIEGNIYIGKVKDIVKGMQSFFVDIGESKNGFLIFSDLEAKTDGVYEKHQEKSNQLANSIKRNDSIIVQVKKDAIDNKGPKLTIDISLIGRYFVLTPISPFIAITKKISDSSLREEFVRTIKQYLPKNYGGIIRTNILEASEEEIKDEIELLISKWEKIKQYKDNLNRNNDIKMIYQESSILDRTIKDVVNKDLDTIFINNRKMQKEIIQVIKKVNDSYVEKVKYVKTTDLLKEYNLRNKIEKDMQRKVWLNCGGHIIISKTEALTAIDVNSGKYTGKKDLESTVFTVNKQAVIEIARQLRLRNIGGIIIVDFIDMKDEKNKNEILELLKEEVKKDRSKINVKGYTSLNLMEITRKKKNI